MMQRTGRNDPCPCGSGKKYKHCCGATFRSEPVDAETHYRRGSTFQEQGRLHEAVASYGNALSLKPDHAQAHNNLGTVFESLGKLDDAVASYSRAVSLEPPSPYFHYNLATVLQAVGKLDEAIVHYRHALSSKPDFAQAHYNLGNALRDQGRVPEAVACYGEALSLHPSYAEAHNNLGWVLQAQGQAEEAIASYRKALSLAPGFAVTHYNLATVLASRGRRDEAIAAYRNALTLRPDHAQAHHDLGNALNETGQIDAALASYQRALALEESAEFKESFAQCIRHIDFIRVDPDVRPLVARALAEPWARPVDLAAAAIRLIKRDSPAASDDALWLALLENAPVTDVSMERLLTAARRRLLDAALAASIDDVPQKEPAPFDFALARQCLINDFVFCHGDEELRHAASLRERLSAALDSGSGIPPLWVVAVAAYFPLLTLRAAQSLLDRRWRPASMAVLLAQHITEPLQERRYREAMPTLTAVQDRVSHEVRRQYEENPYPRWSKLPSAGKAISLQAYLRRRFPNATPGSLDPAGGIDVLVAGCGTGRESIELARQFDNARVLAVDLSVASLAYARRKSLELGLKDIEYAQGDILEMGSIGRTFDFISSVGVLHHLADPVAGLRQLVRLLRPCGFMLLGLYSERARRSVFAARKLIAERGYASNAADIRRCREHLMSLDDGDELKQVTSFSDFYGASECRDLLFHVQEHRFTLPRIKQVLAESGLDFVGFLVDPHVSRKYAERFPNDPAGTDLDAWDAFETGFPNAFEGMYVFLVRRIAGEVRGRKTNGPAPRAGPSS